MSFIRVKTRFQWTHLLEIKHASISWGGLFSVRVIHCNSRNEFTSWLRWMTSINGTHLSWLTTLTLVILLIMNKNTGMLYVSMYLMHSIIRTRQDIMAGEFFSNGIQRWKIWLLKGITVLNCCVHCWKNYWLKSNGRNEIYTWYLYKTNLNHCI